MITSLDQLDMDKTYSYADYLTWRFSEYVELIRGRISRMSAPSQGHQRIVLRLGGLLDAHLGDGSCRVYVAPFDVRLLDDKKSTATKNIYTVVQPDICVICDLEKLDEKGCLGAPDLIVEVLSPATQRKDLNEKFELYEENGVKEYWIIAAQEETVTVFELDEERGFQLRKIYANDENIYSKVVDSFQLDLKKLFSSKKLN